MSNVERFESVMAERLGPHAIIKVEGEYVQPAMRLSLIAWQASRRAALEEAAKHVETLGLVFFFGEQEFAKTGRACTADAIRALATETNNADQA